MGRPGGLCLQKLGPSDVPSAPSCSVAEALTLLGPQFAPLEHRDYDLACPILRETESPGVTEFGEHSPMGGLPWEVLTPLLHEAEEVIQELLPLGVSVQFIELRTEWARVSRMKGRGREALSQPHTSCRQFCGAPGVPWLVSL